MALKHAYTATGTNDTAKQVSVDRWNSDHVVDDATFTIAKTSGLQAALDAKLPLADFTLFAQSTAQQGSGFSADTYLTGSRIVLPAGLVAGSRYKLVLDLNKTAAGTGTPVITVRLGTAGSTADTSRAALTFVANTAAADEARVELLVTFRAVGASAIIQAVCTFSHQLTTTGFGGTGAGANMIRRATSAAFDATPANTGIGVSVNGGTGAVWTVQLVQAELENI